MKMVTRVVSVFVPIPTALLLTPCPLLNVMDIEITAEFEFDVNVHL